MKTINIENWHQYINSKFYKRGGIVFSSSGTTGISKSIIYPDKTIKNANKRLKELMKLTPLAPNSKIVILWGYGLFPPAYYYTQTFCELGHIVCPLGSGKNYKTELKIRELCKILPDVIVGMPSYILKICNLLETEECFEKIKNNIKFIVTGGELLTDGIRNKIENMLNTKIYDSYGMLQVPMIAGECRYGKMHLSKDYIAEVLINNKEIKKSGEGMLLLTSNNIFSNVKMKRFETNDLVILENEKCKCGYSTKTIKILGRKSNIQKIKGQIIDFDLLLKHLDDKGLEDTYYIEIIKDPTDTVIFHVSNRVDIERMKKYIDDIISFNYLITSENDFTILTTKTGKANRIIITDRRG